jgi:hypothetical protein
MEGEREGGKYGNNLKYLQTIHLTRE